ncbi:reverse transcriptase domain-containing protein [Tanacetum coccineum]
MPHSLCNPDVERGRNKLCSNGEASTFFASHELEVKETVELGEYNIIFEPQNAIKGQVLADFISSYREPTESYFRTLEATTERDATKAWTLFTGDASTLKGSKAGLVLIGPSSVEYTYALRLTFVSTNNEAEYEALLAGLRIARKTKVQSLEVKVDSKLVASQINRSYVASNDSMEILVKGLNEQSTDAKEINTVVEEEGDNWMAPIIKCLEEEIWPKDKNKAQCKLCYLRDTHGGLWDAFRPTVSSSESDEASILLAHNAERRERRDLKKLGSDGVEPINEKTFNLEETNQDDEQEISEIFRIETNLFDYETPLRKKFKEFNYLFKIDSDVLTSDIVGFKTYDEYKDDWIYKWNKNVPWVHEKPWTDIGVWTEPPPVDSELKEEALRNKAIMEGLINEDVESNNEGRFEMIKYSFGQDEEYVAIKENEYEDLTSTSEDACRAYQEIFRMMDEGWMVT